MAKSSAAMRLAISRLLLCCAVAGTSLTMAGNVLAQAPDPGPLRDLPEFHSVDGILSAVLDVTEQKVNFGDVTIDGIVYNGDYAGPVLRVHPGDTMRIKLVNHLKEPTNLHFHGIHTSPLGNSDNVHIVVAPGESFDYEVKIPAAQPPGIYWYHAHIHGLSEKQVMGGLSGALIVEGFRDQFPELAEVKERLFVLKNFVYEDSDDPVIDGKYHDIIETINGQLLSNLSIKSGETQLWHFTNQSVKMYFRLRLRGHRFHIIGQDGDTALRETLSDEIVVLPAGRLDVLVVGGAPGDYALTEQHTLTGAGPKPETIRTLARLTVSTQTEQPVPPLARFPDKKDLNKIKPDAYRLVVFSQNAMEGKYYINGKQFDAARIDTRVPLGSIEEWTIRNASDDLHVFHIHQLSFQVTEINGEPQRFNGYIDTVDVPARGEVTLRLPFTDPVIIGTFMYHCHVLEHEDKGMMAHIEVYDPKREHGVLGIFGALDRYLRMVPMVVHAFLYRQPFEFCFV
jgi:suppressor of ftsI